MPAQPPGSAPAGPYDPKVVLEVFRSEGRPAEFGAGQKIFAENETKAGLFSRSDRMYLLLEGEIALSTGTALVSTVRPGEIFGELASITRMPRTATATATRPSRVISMDSGQFEHALQKMPDAALMFLSVIAGRLRSTVARIGDKPDVPVHRGALLHKKVLARLAAEFDEGKQIRALQGKTVMKEGDTGVLMYVVLEGEFLISIRGHAVELVGPGGVFGEMALVDKAPRSASATARTDACLLGINRDDFLGLIRTQPEFGVALLRGMAERLALLTGQLK